MFPLILVSILISSNHLMRKFVFVQVKFDFIKQDLGMIQGEENLLSKTYSYNVTT